MAYELTSAADLAAVQDALGSPKRSTALRFASFGDSTAIITGFTRTTPTTAIDVLTAAYPATGTDSVSLVPFQPDNLFYPVADGGISGQNTTNMLARDAAGYSVNRRATQDILSAYPDVVAFGACINDLTAVTSGTRVSVVDAAYLRHLEIIGRLRGGGALVIVRGVLGYSHTAATSPADTRLALLDLNARLAAYCATVENVLYLETVGLTCDATGAFLSGISNDGTHPSGLGQLTVSSALGQLAYRTFGRAPLVRFPGQNRISNAGMWTSGSVAYGTMATGFSAVVSGGITRQNAAIERIKGANWQTCEFTNAGVWGTTGITMPCDLSATATGMTAALGVTATSRIGVEFDAFVEAIGGGAVTLNLAAAVLDLSKTSNGTFEVSPQIGTFTTTGRKYFKFAIGPVVVNEVQANLSGSRLGFDVYSGLAAQGLKLGVSAPRLVVL